MKPTRFERSNIIMERPKGWTAERCSDIHAFRGVDASGQPIVITVWKPTDAERVKIAAGEPVYLILYGGEMQPAIVTADDPFEQ